MRAAALIVILLTGCQPYEPPQPTAPASDRQAIPPKSGKPPHPTNCWEAMVNGNKKTFCR